MRTGKGIKARGVLFLQTLHTFGETQLRMRNALRRRVLMFDSE